MMRKLSLLCIVLGLLASCGQQKSSDSLTLSSSDIVGGPEVTTSEFDSVVELYFERDSKLYLCSGTIISKSIILTAAHCVRSKDFLSNHVILLRTRNGRRVNEYKTRAIAVLRHPLDGSDHKDFNHDSALLRVNADFSKLVTIIPLATNDEFKEIIQTQKVATLVGYGERADGHSGDKMLKVDTEFGKASTYHLHFPDGTKNSRGGDSGGPAFMKNAKGEYRLVGSTSFGAYNLLGSEVDSGYLRADVINEFIGNAQIVDQMLVLTKKLLTDLKTFENMLEPKCAAETIDTKGMTITEDPIFYSDEQEFTFKNGCKSVSGLIKVKLKNIYQSVISGLGKDIIKVDAIITTRDGRSMKGVLDIATDGKKITSVSVYDTHWIDRNQVFLQTFLTTAH